MSTGDPPASRAISKRLAAGDVSRHPPKPIRKKGLGSFSRDDLLVVTDHSDTLMELNQKSFPLDSDGYSKLGYNTVFNESQSHLLKVISICHYARTEIGTSQKEPKCFSSQLRKVKAKFSSEKERHKIALTAKDEEYQSFKTYLEDQIATARTTEQELLHKVQRQENRTRRAPIGGSVTTRWKMVFDFKK